MWSFYCMHTLIVVRFPIKNLLELLIQYCLCGAGHEGVRLSCYLFFCYQLIAKPGNKTATPPWPDHYPVITNLIFIPIGVISCRVTTIPVAILVLMSHDMGNILQGSFDYNFYWIEIVIKIGYEIWYGGWIEGHQFHFQFNSIYINIAIQFIGRN